MYVCMYVCMYVYMYVYMYVCMYVCIFSIHAYTHVQFEQLVKYIQNRNKIYKKWFTQKGGVGSFIRIEPFITAVVRRSRLRLIRLRYHCHSCSLYQKEVYN